MAVVTLHAAYLSASFRSITSDIAGRAFRFEIEKQFKSRAPQENIKSQDLHIQSLFATKVV